MSTQKFQGELEIDFKRGVIYFHLTTPCVIQHMKAVTLLRVSGLPPLDKPVMHPIDITYAKEPIIGWGELKT
jgi:hypothetical protein